MCVCIHPYANRSGMVPRTSMYFSKFLLKINKGRESESDGEKKNKVG